MEYLVMGSKDKGKKEFKKPKKDTEKDGFSFYF